MSDLEVVLGLLVVAVALATAARRLGLPPVELDPNIVFLPKLLT